MAANGASTIRNRYGSRLVWVRRRSLGRWSRRLRQLRNQGANGPDWERINMVKVATKRRQRHGSAWYWKQTDSWYYTPPGTKQRVALFDEHGKRIRGQQN